MNTVFYTGIVESRDDPLELGRLKVRVFGVHSELLADVPLSALPWAIPLMPATSASLSGIGHSPTQYIEGTQVIVYFQDGESKQQPIILGSYHGIPMEKTPWGSSGAAYSGEKFGNSIVPQSSSSTGEQQPPAKDGTATEVKKPDAAPAPGEAPAATPAPTPAPAAGDGPCCSGVDTTKAVAKYGDNVNLMCKALCDAGIKDKNAIIAILANVAKECGFQPKRENLNYTTVARLKAVYPSKFGSMSDADASTYLNNPEKLGSYVMGDRYGNGSASTGDGYKYRGGGFIQLTFKGNYKAVGDKIGVDLVSNPDAITDPAVSAKAAAQFFVNAYGGANRVAFGSVDEALNSVTRKVNPGGFDRDIIKVREAAALFGEGETKAPVEAAQPNKPENQIKKDATQKEINDGIVNGKPANGGGGGSGGSKGGSSSSGSGSGDRGFSDPNKKYPLDSLLKEQDTNRLARRNTKMTLVETKNKNRRTGIKNLEGSTFDEPATAYNAKYPFNQIFFSESGHALEFDDTAGSERINLYHTAGTFIEIDKFGNQTNKIIGDNFSITERNGYIYIDGVARLSVGSDVKVLIGGNLDIEVDGDVTYDVGGDVTWKIGGDLKYGIGGLHSIQSGGMTAIDSSQIHLNASMAESVDFSSRGAGGTDYPLQVPGNYMGAKPIEFDDDDPDAVDIMHAFEIAAGTMTRNQLDEGAAKKPEKVDEAPPPKKEEPIPENCLGFADKADIPDGTQLSKSYTLGMLSTNAYFGHKTVAQAGLTKAEIVCNLKKLAENTLDKVKAKYPKMFITSGFRPGSGKSDHEKGKAADMQFPGSSKAEYFEIAQWIKDNVPFSQLILEYQTTGTGTPWIHIAYGGNSATSVLTYMNGHSKGPGLQKLG